MFIAVVQITPGHTSGLKHWLPLILCVGQVVLRVRAASVGDELYYTSGLQLGWLGPLGLRAFSVPQWTS